MPNPKRRHSKARTGSRRAHDSLKSHSLSECPNCHERKMPHRACPKCGYYKGREVLERQGSQLAPPFHAKRHSPGRDGFRPQAKA